MVKRLRRCVGRSVLSIFLTFAMVVTSLYLPENITEKLSIDGTHVHAANTIEGLWCQNCAKYVTDFQYYAPENYSTHVDYEYCEGCHSPIYDPDLESNVSCGTCAGCRGACDDCSKGTDWYHQPSVAIIANISLDYYYYYRYALGVLPVQPEGHINSISKFTTAGLTEEIGLVGSNGLDTMNGVQGSLCSFDAFSGPTHLSDTEIDTAVYALKNTNPVIRCKTCKNTLITINPGGLSIPAVTWDETTNTFWIHANANSHTATFGMVNAGAYVGFPSKTFTLTTGEATSAESIAVASLIQSLCSVLVTTPSQDSYKTAGFDRWGTITSNYTKEFSWSDWLNACKRVTPNGTYYEGLNVYLSYMGYNTGLESDTELPTTQDFTITYSANGGSTTPTAATVTEGGTVTLPTSAGTKSGYTFAGWSTSANGAVTYTGGQTITPTDNMTLYAVWNEIKYTITYNANGGTGTMAASSISSNGGTLTANAFTKTGHTFAGWSTSANGSVVYSNSSNIVPSKNMTLYAVWSVNKSSVTLNNVGTGSSGAASSVAYGTTVTVNAGTKVGHSFNNWIVNSGGVTLANASKSSTTFTMPNSAVTLTASWSPISYDVTVTGAGTGGTAASSKAAYGSTVTLNAGTKEGHTFKGWRVLSGGATLANSSSATTTFTMPAGAVSVVADWAVNNYTVTIMNGGTDSTGVQNIAYDTTVTVDAGYREGYYFCGWEVAGTNVVLADPALAITTFKMPAGNVVLNATWKHVSSISASLNDSFYSTFNNEEYTKDGGNSYNVNKQIRVVNTMIDLLVTFSDGSTSLATTDTYTVDDRIIDRVGTNNMIVTFTAGNCNLTQSIELNGYSPELDEVMESLSVAEGDYAGLATEVGNLQLQISQYISDLAKYEQNLLDIKTALKKGNIDLTLKGTLEERLAATNEAINQAVMGILVSEAELNRLDSQVNSIMKTLDMDTELYEDFDTLSEVLKHVSKEISKVKANEQFLIENVNALAEKLNIKYRIENGADVTTTSIFEAINNRLDELRGQLDEYKAAMDGVKDSLGIENDGSVTSQLDEIVEKINQKTEDLENLETELADIMEGLEESGIIVDTESMSQTETIMAQINGLKEYASALVAFRDNIIATLGLNAGVSDEEVYAKVQEILDQLDAYEAFMKDVETLIPETGTVDGDTPMSTTEKLANAFTELEDMKKQLEAYEATIQELLGSSGDLGIENVEDLTEALNRVQNQKTEADTFIATLGTSLGLGDTATYEDIIKKTEELKGNLAAYETELGKLREALGILDASGVVDTQGITQAMNVVQSNISTLQKDLADMTALQQSTYATLLVRESTIEELEDTITGLRQQLQTMTSEKGQVELQLASLKTENAVLTTEKKSLETEVASLKAELEALKKKNSELAAENSNLKTEVASLKNLNSNQASQITSLTTSVKTYESKVKTLTTEKETLERSNEALQDSLDEKNEIIKDLNTTIAEATRQIQSLTSQLENDASTSEEQKAALQALQEQATVTEQKLAEAQELIKNYEQTVLDLESTLSVIQTTTSTDETGSSESEDGFGDGTSNTPTDVTTPVVVNYLQPTLTTTLVNGTGVETVQLE